MFALVLLASLLSVAFGAAVPSLDGRIIGGDLADIADYPYMVALLGASYVPICGGALISTTWVVTATHCVEGGSYWIRAGSSNKYSQGQVVPVASVITHEKYDDVRTDYDIAVLKLAFPVSVANAIPISLAAAGDAPVPGSPAVITGWGQLTEGGLRPVELYVVTIPVVSQAVCSAAYGKGAITDRMFCAGVMGVGGKDSCLGDSGGPVVIDGLLTGIVSFGMGCAQADYPGVYTNVPTVRSWIKEKTGI